jgi:hypothetical protein
LKPMIIRAIRIITGSVRVVSIRFPFLGWVGGLGAVYMIFRLPLSPVSMPIGSLKIYLR